VARGNLRCVYPVIDDNHVHIPSASASRQEEVQPYEAAGICAMAEQADSCIARAPMVGSLDRHVNAD
jgi:hypothetical protein